MYNKGPTFGIFHGLFPHCNHLTPRMYDTLPLLS